MLKVNKNIIESLPFYNKISFLGMWKIETDPFPFMKRINAILQALNITHIDTIEVQKVFHHPSVSTGHRFHILINGQTIKITKEGSKAIGQEVATRTLEQYIDILSTFDFIKSNKNIRSKIKSLSIGEKYSFEIVRVPSALFNLTDDDIYYFLTEWIFSKNMKWIHLGSTIMMLAMYWAYKDVANNEFGIVNVIDFKTKSFAKLSNEDFIKQFGSTLSQTKFQDHKDIFLKAIEFFIEQSDEYGREVSSYVDIRKIISSYRSTCREIILFKDRQGKNDIINCDHLSRITPDFCDAAHIIPVSKIKADILSLISSGKQIHDDEIKNKLQLITDVNNLKLLPHPVHYFFDLGLYEFIDNKLVLTDDDYRSTLESFNLPDIIELQ